MSTLGIAALAIRFVLAVWWSFASNGYTDFLLVVVSGLSWPLWRLHWCCPAVTMWTPTAHRFRHHRFSAGLRKNSTPGSISWRGDAAAEVLLPIAAIAFGMTAIGIVTHVVSHGAR
jgi:hypothetical protein